MAFTAGFFFGQPFFFTSMRYLGLGLLFFSLFFPARSALSVFSCSVFIITHFFFPLLQRGGHSGEIGGRRKIREVDRRYQPASRSAKLGLYDGQNWIAMCVRRRGKGLLVWTDLWGAEARL